MIIVCTMTFIDQVEGRKLGRWGIEVFYPQVDQSQLKSVFELKVAPLPHGHTVKTQRPSKNQAFFDRGVRCTPKRTCNIV